MMANAKFKTLAKTIRRLLDYDPVSGIWTWKKRAGPPFWNAQFSGKRAGTLLQNGYRRIRFAGFIYYEHRLAFLWMTGTMPTEVDHRNGLKDDNRWINLRAATRQQNAANSPIRRNNTSGFKGVSWSKGDKRWQAHIMIDGRSRFLGFFPTAADAAIAYSCVAEREFGEFARTE